MHKEDIRFENGTVLEGMISIRALLKAKEAGINNRKIIRILYSDKADGKTISYLMKISDKEDFTVEKTDTIESYATGSSHGGIIAQCDKRDLPYLTKEIFKELKFSVLIDGIEDPYNFGYALRSVYAAGADAVILRERNWMNAAGVVARASAGASEMMKAYVLPEKFKDIISSSNTNVIIADEKSENSLEDIKFTLPLLLIAGGEKRGISKDIKELATDSFRIDYGRDFHQSLSAASAITISAFEVLRQNKYKIQKLYSSEE